MAKITKITGQKKRSDRFSIFIDGAYAFSLSEFEMANSGLREGLELNGEEVEKWQGASETGKVMDSAYRYLSYRPRTEQEMQLYLEEQEVPVGLATKVIDDLRQQAYLDDAAFAQTWVRERQAMQPRSKSHLRMELRKKGISAEIIEAALGEISDEAEVKAITDLIAQKRLRSRYNEDKKLIAYIISKGFSYGKIKQALNRS